jgi:hypothetical protein
MTGLLLYGDTERSPALRHEVPIPIGDPFLFAEVDGRQYVLTSRLEEHRVRRALPDAEGLDYFGLGYKGSWRRAACPSRGESRGRGTRRAESGSRRRSSWRFPLALGDRLGTMGSSSPSTMPQSISTER